MPSLKLYTAMPSRGLTVQWLLAELGLDYELQLLSIEQGEHKQEAFRAINPLGRVPVLAHGEVIITETAAICAYLAEQFSPRELNVAPDEAQRGAYLRWLFFAPASAEPAILCSALGFSNPDYQPFASIEAVGETLRQALSGNTYIVADRFTAADVMIGSAVNWGLHLMPVLPKIPELVTYWERLAQRPAWKKIEASFFQ